MLSPVEVAAGNDLDGHKGCYAVGGSFLLAAFSNTTAI